jgi:hypothetical protein
MNDRWSEPFGEKEENEGQAPFHMMWFVGQFFLIPVAAFVYGVELLVKTMQGMQKATTQGMSLVVGSTPEAAENVGGSGEGDVSVSQPSPVNTQESGPTNADATEKREEKTLSNDGNGIGRDKDLHDDMLKLVRYKILFVKREYEHAFSEKEDLVSDNMDGSAFTAWKVAEFIQGLNIDKTKDEKDSEKYRDKASWPKKWKDKGYPEGTYVYNGYLVGLPEGDKKYLRVYYEVLDRYPREKFKYEEQQIRVLEQIRDKMQSAPTPTAAPITPSTPTPTPAPTTAASGTPTASGSAPKTARGG